MIENYLITPESIKAYVHTLHRDLGMSKKRRSLKVLVIGSGNGWILSQLKKYGIDAFGMDERPYYVSRTVKRFKQKNIQTYGTALCEMYSYRHFDSVLLLSLHRLSDTIAESVLSGVTGISKSVVLHSLSQDQAIRIYGVTTLSKQLPYWVNLLYPVTLIDSKHFPGCVFRVDEYEQPPSFQDTNPEQENDDDGPNTEERESSLY